MRVREFIREDKKAFLELCERFYESGSTVLGFNKAIAEKTFLRVLDHHENLWGYLFTDEDTGSLVGYALTTSYWSNEEGGDVIVLDEIYIDPVNRHKGYAHIFMNWLDEHFCDAAAITLEVLESNTRACKFYEKAGFKPDGYISYSKKIKR